MTDTSLSKGATAMNTITEPLRLAVGSHSAGSGKGCAMNLVSWENGDTTITDLPDCADTVLARIVQAVNDNICTHRDGDLLCPACSIKVIDLAHRTVGTGSLPLTPSGRHKIWVRIAIDQARAVLQLVPDKYKDHARSAIEAAQVWVENPCEETRRNAYAAATAAANAAAYAAAYAAYAANAAAYAADAAYAAATAAAYAANAAAYAADAAYAAANAAAYAANAAAYAADAAAARGEKRLALAHRAIDLFEELTGHVRVPVSPEQIQQAYACMTTAH
jgi:hypothetical protein